MLDSTGLELFGQGEWCAAKHGRLRRRWLKLHLGMGTSTSEIVAASLTAKEIDDGAEVGPLLDQATGVVASFTADGGYDQDRIYASVTNRHPEAVVVVPPRATAAPSDTAETAPTQRDRHLQHSAEHGRMAWQKASAYTTRARAETAISRFKQVIGNGLRSRTDDRRATEVAVAVHAALMGWTPRRHLRAKVEVLISHLRRRPWDRLARSDWTSRSGFSRHMGRMRPGT